MNRQPLSKYVKAPEVDSLQLHLQWHSVNQRVRRRRQVRTGLVALSVLLVVGLVGAYGLRTPSEMVQAGQSAYAELEPKTLRLAEGSEWVLSPRSAVRVEEATDEEVVIILEHGRGEFEVARRPSRRFVVRAGAVEVRVVGTKFTVLHEGPRVEVLVLRGIVEVREGNAVTRLEKGGRWSRLLEAEPAAAARIEEPDLKQPAQQDGEEAPDQAPADVSPATHDDQPLSTVNRRVTRQKHRLGGGAAAPQGASPLSPQPKDTAHADDARPADAFAAAMNARTNGRNREALAAFQLISERWPSSAFAPMSAFEWGRLALESAHDPQQAAHAFERTLELATSVSLIEDALARLTEAYARFDLNACRRSRAEYIRRFPEGPHVRGVTQACPP